MQRMSKLAEPVVSRLSKFCDELERTPENQRNAVVARFMLVLSKITQICGNFRSCWHTIINGVIESDMINKNFFGKESESYHYNQFRPEVIILISQRIGPVLSMWIILVSFML